MVLFSKKKKKERKLRIFESFFSNQLLVFTASLYACHFSYIEGQRFTVLIPKIPYYATNDLNNGLMRSKNKWNISASLTFLQNIDTVKDKFERFKTL